MRFKGLESPIVILWGLDSIDKPKRLELLYVGFSRAKS
ncbi:MAG: ATP-binding domain-containing protein, partial [Fimbriimonadaceae bacterium]